MVPDRTVILNRYELDPVHIGKGGMGTVYEGKDTVLKRRVAIKLISTRDGMPDAELERRFEREARVMAELAHPGAPAIYDVGTFDDPLLGRRMFLVMEFVDGITLDDIVSEHGPLPLGWAAVIGAQVAAVLSAAHDREILHRDLKPSNIMVCSDGTVKVLDFGLAMLHDPAIGKLTQTGQTVGTPSYMPPEQIRAAALTPQSDLYALGCVIHELLTGRPLFTGPTEFSVKEQHINATPPPLRAYRPDVPREFDDLIGALLAKRMEDRPASAAAVHDLLMPYVTGVGHLPGVTTPGPSPVRMYAHAVSRILGSPEAVSRPVAESVTGHERESLHRSDLERARREAMSLARDSNYRRAIEVLAAVAEPASRLIGADDPEVLSLRVQLAHLRFEAGDYPQAAAAFHRLVRDLAKRHGPDDERVFQCRMQEAACHEHLGDRALALRLLRDLLADELRAYPADDPRTLELRRQIGDLERRTGDIEAARRTLAQLHDDLNRRYGPDHPATVRVRDHLAALDW